MPTDKNDLFAQTELLSMAFAETGRAVADALSVIIHAPFENFLKIWNYIPITIWWKTFAPELFNVFGKPTDIIAQQLPSGFYQAWFKLPGDISTDLGKASKAMGEDLFKFTKLSLSLALSPKLPESSPEIFTKLVD